MSGLKKGGAVGWKSHGGTAHGKAEKELTSPIEIKGHKVAASKENPEYLVRSESGDGKAAHKRGALTKE